MEEKLKSEIDYNDKKNTSLEKQIEELNLIISVFFYYLIN